MKRTVTRHPLDESNYRYRVSIESSMAPVATVEYKKYCYDLLKTVIETPGMLDCGVAFFETMHVRHDGEKWIVELEATGP